MRVFTEEEVRERRIPSRDGFSSVGARIREELARAEWVIAAMIHGSFLRGDSNCQSDIDVVALYRHGERRTMVALQQRLQLVGAQYFVPVRIITIDAVLAGHGDHSILPMYQQHLRLAVALGGVIKSNPVPLISPRVTTYQEEARSYHTMKLNAFDKAEERMAGMDEAEEAVAIGKALSFPIHAARKVLQCLSTGPLARDDKCFVTNTYAQLGIPGANDVFFELLGLGRMYQEQLAECLAGRMNLDGYAVLFHRLKAAIPLARDFAELNLHILRERSLP